MAAGGRVGGELAGVLDRLAHGLLVPADRAQASPVLGEGEEPIALRLVPFGLGLGREEPTTVVVDVGDGRLPAVEAFDADAEALGGLDFASQLRFTAEAVCEKGTDVACRLMPMSAEVKSAYCASESSSDTSAQSSPVKSTFLPESFR